MTHPGPSERALRVTDAFSRGDIDLVLSLIHPDMVLSSYLVPERTIRGRDEVVQTIRERVGPMYEMHLDTTEDLSSTVALGSGSVRYSSDGVVTTRSLYWLWTFDEAGLLTSSTTCSSLNEAMALFEELR
jgi:hypothetical protein